MEIVLWTHLTCMDCKFFDLYGLCGKKKFLEEKRTFVAEKRKRTNFNMRNYNDVNESFSGIFIFLEYYNKNVQ